ncbi:MAG TPA: discoidin domain-containing protein [Polyangia bacterium]|nr:discoidin domain-containing protein [Polyangia bacterium]
MKSLTAVSRMARVALAVYAAGVGAAAVAVAPGCAADLVDDESTQSATAALGSFSVLTRNYDNQRSGANLNESILKPSNVTPTQFGKIFQVSVDDQVYAGILYASAVPMGGTTHNVFYVATVSNTVYAFDADAGGGPLWQRSDLNGVGRPARNTDVGSACGTYRDFSGNIGIIGTPVIDAGSMTMYVVTRSVEGRPVFRLRALNIATGQDRPGSPREITFDPAVNPGTNGGNVAFDPQPHNQRAALALSGGVVYVAFASFCDTGPYHGWVMGYDTQSLSQVGVVNDTPSGSQAGIWMAGAAPLFDNSGNLYVSTGNGTFDEGAGNFGESLVKYAPRSLARLDFFTPSNFATLNGNDTDFGSAGPIFLPGTGGMLATGGKEGRIFLMNSGNLGHMVPGDQNVPQIFQAVDLNVRPMVSHHIHNSPVVWNSPQGLNMYIWGENDFLRSYRFDANARRFNVPSASTGSVLPPQGMPGGMMSISASGSAPGTGILWATTPRAGDANQNVVPGILSAFNAETLALLWQSTAPADDPMNFSKGSPPTVASGKVYVASLSGMVSVYGLRTAPANPNLALGKAATGSAPCASTESADRAFNGSTSGGNGDKWCSLTTPQFLQVDLGSSMSVNQFIIRHAGAGGEMPAFDTRDFNIQLSNDGSNFTTAVTVTGNAADVTTHNIATTTARFVRLNIVTPTQNGDPAARIYELEVYGTTSPHAAPVTFETESLPVAATSGDLHRVAQDTGYSGGAGTILEANAAGDFVTYTVNVPEARTYDVRVRVKKFVNRGIWQLSVDGTPRGPATDCWTQDAVFTEVDLGPVAFPSAGNKAFRFSLTGANGNSSGLWTALDYIRLIPQ